MDVEDERGRRRGKGGLEARATAGRLPDVTTHLAALAILAAVAQVPPLTLRTRWAAEVSVAQPLPEYPRPQLVRPRWQSLNGRWSFAVRDSAAPRPRMFDGTILVPFAIESQLSGVQRTVTPAQRLWYRRPFRITAPSVPGTHWLLHFGAVDWDAAVYVNGRRVGDHRGGYDPFTIDVTAALRPRGDQELVVSVWDPTDRGDQPRGKQVLAPGSIWYTAVTGIWQSVWLEPVPPVWIDALHVTPDPDAGTVRVAVVLGRPSDVRMRAVVRSGDSVVAAGEGPVHTPLVLVVPRVRLWSPDDPFLYGVSVALSTGDSVESYFGMRKIAVSPDSGGALRLFLNGRALFEFGTLDQGWWPDGLYTAPTDSALRSDVEILKRLGFNTIRKHVKVEPERWYYDCDRLGMLVWQDMPSGDNRTAAGRREFAAELQRVVDALRNHPSIVMWVPFNEGWGQHETERYVTWLATHDSTRLVDNASGWTDQHIGDVADVHAYPGPGIPPPDARRARVLGEFGGLGLPLGGHTWAAERSWGYRRFADTAALAVAYHDLLYQLRFLEGEGLAAAIYTQTTDVEIEVNGVLTYDRAVVKLPAAAAEWNRRLYRPPPIRRTAVATSEAAGRDWRYATQAPAGDWFQPTYNDSGWREGVGGFGADSTPGAVVRTQWHTADLWLRRTFELRSAAELVAPHWRVHHDEDAEVYLNGELVARFDGYTTAYVMVPLEPRAVAALKAGVNTIAVHVHQTRGGQYFDIGIDEVIDR